MCLDCLKRLPLRLSNHISTFLVSSTCATYPAYLTLPVVITESKAPVIFSILLLLRFLLVVILPPTSSTLKLQCTSFTSFAWKNTVLSHTACEDKSMVLPKIEPSFTPKITLLWRKIPRVQWYDLDWILLVGDLHVIGLRAGFGSGSTGNIWFRPVSNFSNQMLYQAIHFHKEKVSHDSWYRLKHWKCWLQAVK